MFKRISALLIVVLAITLSLAGTSAYGQKKEKVPAEKTVTGIVTDVTGNAVPGAVVQLKNMKTLQVKSFIAKEKGDYYFHGLSVDVDYQLLAQANGKESPTRTISTFDNHMTLTINFQVK